jgi:hypothetical protein
MNLLRLWLLLLVVMVGTYASAECAFYPEHHERRIRIGLPERIFLSAAEARTCVTQLSDDDFDVRTQAFNRLCIAGEEILPAVRAARPIRFDPELSPKLDHLEEQLDYGAIVNGISIRLNAAQTQLHSGRVLNLRYRYINHSATAMVLAATLKDLPFIQLHDHGKTVEIIDPLLLLRESEYGSLDLQPFRSSEQPLGLLVLTQKPAEKDTPTQPYIILAPGEHSLRIESRKKLGRTAVPYQTYEYRTPAGESFRSNSIIWDESVPSNEVKITVTE